MYSIVTAAKLLFVLPSIVFGYACSIPALKYLYGYMSKGQSNIKLSYFPTFKATLLGVTLGILIPFLWSVVSIQNLLSKNLIDSLYASRSKTKGSIVSINEGNMQKIGTYLLLGGLAIIA